MTIVATAAHENMSGKQGSYLWQSVQTPQLKEKCVTAGRDTTP